MKKTQQFIWINVNNRPKKMFTYFIYKQTDTLHIYFVFVKRLIML